MEFLQDMVDSWSLALLFEMRGGLGAVKPIATMSTCLKMRTWCLEKWTWCLVEEDFLGARCLLEEDSLVTRCLLEEDFFLRTQYLLEEHFFSLSLGRELFSEINASYVDGSLYSLESGKPLDTGRQTAHWMLAGLPDSSEDGGPLDTGGSLDSLELKRTTRGRRGPLKDGTYQNEPLKVNADPRKLEWTTGDQCEPLVGPLEARIDHLKADINP
ncbi:hypothetical protein DM860_008959 [Cuscuta australis]|uniref:Uncharacterized protein n=1 Tax=Cuscuta australis TaxID=267555 RepID=A0A328D7M2_9ASTE|nr:hypothetical protein DM860_008959 [Cuscuta australis]